jgi:ketosteroid isomerase-like protein
MKKILFVSLMLVAIMVPAFAAGTSEVKSTSRAAASVYADELAIEALWANYGKYAMAGNLDGFLSLHDREAYKMPQDQAMFQPWAVAKTMRVSWTNQRRSGSMYMRVDPKEIVVVGNYAYTMGTYVKEFTPKDGGPKAMFDGKFLTVLHKDAHGAWKIYRDCYNSNTPPTK